MRKSAIGNVILSLFLTTLIAFSSFSSQFIEEDEIDLYCYELFLDEEELLEYMQQMKNSRDSVPVILEYDTDDDDYFFDD